ncbi:MAG: FCD domain-containing protein [Anaerolineae bacterium]
MTLDRLPSIVAQQLEDLIVNQVFEVGERLPAERDLALQLGVSRNALREAVKVLEERGLLEVRTGSGIYVTEIDATPLTRSVTLYVKSQQVSIHHVYQTRWILETQNARLAALHATEDDLAALRACIARSEAHVHEPSLFTPLDVEYHMQLARASHNPVLPLLLETITDALRDQCRLTEQLPGAQENALSYHRRILQAIEAHDDEAAYRAMDDHIRNGWEWLRRALSNPREEIGPSDFMDVNE